MEHPNDKLDKQHRRNKQKRHYLQAIKRGTNGSNRAKRKLPTSEDLQPPIRPDSEDV
jgi:hypothetical protein